MELTCIKKNPEVKPQSNGNFESSWLLFFDTIDVPVQSNLYNLCYKYFRHGNVIAYYSTMFSVILFQHIGTSNDDKGMLYMLKMLVKISLSIYYLSVKARQHSGFSCWNCLWLYVIDYLIFCFSNVITLFKYIFTL